MSRKLFFAIVLIGVSCTAGLAQEWATKMFETTSHDFGTVPRGAKAEFAFVLENLYVEDIHIANAYASCGCTSPELQTPSLKTHEKGAILAKFNTAAFLGQRAATITVTIDHPFFAQVQLHVTGFIRDDVLVEPGSVELGSVNRGSVTERKVAIQHFGRNDWQILGVQSPDPHLSARVAETGRSDDQVNYDLVVRLDANAPDGYLRSQLILQTNDASGSQFPVTVEGRIQPTVTVSPTSLFLGVVEPGQKVTRQLVVKGKEAFRITAVHCDGKDLTFDTSAEAAPKQLHLIPVTFVAGKDPGKVNEVIHIETTLKGVEPVVSASAVVVTPNAKQ